MERSLNYTDILFFYVLFCCICSCSHLSSAQAPTPAKFDGFPYRGSPVWGQSVLVEAYLDPMCPDSRDSWLPLKQALDYYSPHVSLVVHSFPNAFHDNAYMSCLELHIANKLNASTTYPLLELLFGHQEDYYNRQTENISRASVRDKMSKLAMTVIGNSSLSTFEAGFKDQATNIASVTSFKYGCSRGVDATPFFFINGFAMPGFGSAVSLDGWKNILDPLVGKRLPRDKNGLN